MIDDATERKRLARAAWSYKQKDQKALAEETGIAYGTLKGLLSNAGRNPSHEQLVEIVRACDVPDRFAAEGWAAIERPAVEMDRLSALEGQIRQLRAGLVALAAGDLQRTRALLGQAGTGRPRAPRASDQ